MSDIFDLETGQEVADGSTATISSPTKKDPEVVLSEKLFSRYRDRRVKWAMQYQLDRDFKDGAMWTREATAILERDGMAAVVINTLHPAIEQAKAALTANPPRFSTTGREGSDLKVGAMFADLLSYVWSRSRGDEQLKRAIDDYFCGMGVLLAYHDPMADNNKGEVLFKAINPLDVYVDPNSKDASCQDAAHIILSGIMTTEQIQTFLPDVIKQLSSLEPVMADEGHPVTTLTGPEGQGSSNEEVDLYHRKYRVIDRYSKIKVSYYRVYDPKTGMEKVLDDQAYMKFLAQPTMVEISKNAQPLFLTTDAQIAQATELASTTGGTFHYALDQMGERVMQNGEENAEMDAQVGLRTIPGSTIQLVPTNMRYLISVGVVEVSQAVVPRIKRVYSVGGKIQYLDLLPLELYPIIFIMNQHNRNPYPSGDIRTVRPICEVINKLESLIIAHASNATNVKLLIPRGSQDKKQLQKEWQKTGAVVIDFDAELGAPIVAGPVPLPNELYKDRDDLRMLIQEILGVYALSQGDPGQAPNTYKGTVAMDEMGQRRMKSKKDDIEAALTRLGEVIIQMIQSYYTEPRVLRLIRPNNSPLDIPINQELVEDRSGEVIGKLNDVTIGKYDIEVVSGSTLPVNRWARFEYYETLYKDGIIDQVEVLKQTEVADMEGVLKRMDQIKMLQQQLMQAEQQIKELSGDLQTAQREAVHANMRTEVEKYKGGLTTLQTKAEAATHLYTQRLGDEVSKHKAELAADRKAKSRPSTTK